MSQPLTPTRQGHARSTGVSSCFGTCGELLQGVDTDGTDFLVTMPIACWSTARVTLEPDVPGIRVDPPHKHKSVRLARAVLSAAGYSGGGRVVLRGDLPEGKGLASSSADLVATARAVGNALGVPMPPATIERYLRQIEPSDGVMHDAVTVFDHRGVALRARLGSLPPVTLVTLDEGGTVDTVRFNEVPKPFGPAERREYARLLAELTTAVAAGDVRALGRVTTRSAELNQRLHAKRTLSRLLSVAEELDVPGVVVAHSGTVLGLVIADDDPEYRTKRALAEQACAALGGRATTYHSLSFH